MADTLESLEPVTRQDLTLATTARLAQLIATLPAGARLPTERELCERLRVGRSTLRESVRSLAFIGALQTRQGSGIYVGTQEDAPVEKLIGLALMLQRSSVGEIVEVRRILEVEAVRLAAERYGEADRIGLEAAMDSMRRYTEMPQEAARFDTQYHILLARASHNTALTHFLSGMRSLLEKWICLAVTSAAIVRDIIEEHEAVLRAVFRRQPDRAAAYMLIHLTNAAERLFAAVGREQSAAKFISLLLLGDLKERP